MYCFIFKFLHTTLVNLKIYFIEFRIHESLLGFVQNNLKTNTLEKKNNQTFFKQDYNYDYLKPF